MFNVLKFIKRHKKKCLASGLIISGFVCLTSYAKRRQTEREHAMANILAKTRRQHHYDSNLQTCNSTVISMMPTLRDIVMDKLNAEELKDQLNKGLGSKIELWQQLKITCFTRTLTILYSLSILITFIRTQLNVIGGYIFVDKFINSCENMSVNEGLINTVVQHKYLALVQHLFSEGLNLAMEDVHQTVEEVLGSRSLNEKIDVKCLQQIFNEMHIILNKRLIKLPAIVMTSSQKKASNPFNDNSSNEDSVFNALKLETADIILSEDFQLTVSSCLSAIFDWLYAESSLRLFPSEESINNTFLPMAKLIPVIDSLLATACDEHSIILTTLFNNDVLANFSMNVYESFSHKLHYEFIKKTL